MIRDCARDRRLVGVFDDERDGFVELTRRDYMELSDFINQRGLLTDQDLLAWLHRE
jgi:hypothetical protein